ncbi:hypothetical protein BKN14_05530 [Candidatus Gracilibacteria bacterium HOT-871]|nr:hypothetical protein BKN14_05530 [Candidatus Gracilibacteria bacterium HOT-871]
MFEFIKFLQKRPSDKTIITIRLLFGLILVSVLYYNFFLDGANNNEIEKTMLFGYVDTTGFSDVIKYAIVSLGLFPILYGIANIFNIGIAKKKYIKIGQIILAILLWYSAALVVNTESLDINELLVLMGFLPFFAGITGKMITSKSLKYGEKINKIRV